MRKIFCPVCNTKATKFELSSYDIHGRKKLGNKKFTYHKCSKCYSVFLVGQKISNQFYKKYYPKNYYQKSSGFIDFVESLIVGLSVRHKVKIINSFFKDKDNIQILDIGCGDFKFLEGLDKGKFVRFGIDIKVGQSKKRLNIIEGDFLTHRFGRKKFDIITAWHSLEHIQKPDMFMRKAYALIGSGGLFLLSTPNTRSLGYKIGRENWFHLDSPRHVVLYNLKAIEELAKNSGFKLIRSLGEKYSFPLDIVWSARFSKLKYLILPTYPLVKALSNETKIYVLQKK